MNMTKRVEKISKALGCGKRMVHAFHKEFQASRLEIEKNLNSPARIFIWKYIMNTFKYWSDVKFTAFFL